MIKVNLTDFVSHLRKIQKRTSHAAVGEIIRGKVIRVFKEIVMSTPQWSGAAASGWCIYLRGGSRGATPSGRSVFTAPMFSKGDDPAVSAAFARSSWVNGVTSDFLQGCVISNPQPYVEMLEDVTINLRSVNLPGRMVERAIMRNAKPTRININKNTLADEVL